MPDMGATDRGGLDDAGQRFADWVERNVDVRLDPWQRAVLDRMFVAPLGAAPPTGPDDPVWQPVGTTTFGFDLADDDGSVTIAVATIDDDGITHVTTKTIGPDDRWFTRPPAPDTTRSITLTTSLAANLSPAMAQLLGPDEQCGAYPGDSLHPASQLAWEQTVEGRGPDGEPLVVCEHCGEPVPCVESVLRHMDTDTHHRLCLPLGRCYHARRPIEELPGR